MPDSRPPIPGMQPLRTERFCLRPLVPGDAAALHRLVNDWEVAKMLARVPFPYPRALADEFIASTRTSMAEGRAWHLAITGQEAEREVLIGCVGVTHDAEAGQAELGYWIGRRYWGHGAAGEAATRLLHWSLANLPVSRVVASALVENRASQAVLRRIGFREDGDGVRDFISRGGGMPVRLFAAGREDIGAASAPQPKTRPAEPAAPSAPPRSRAFARPAEAAATPPALVSAPADAVATDGTVAAPVAKPMVLVAACALVDADGRVLLARRPEGKPLAGLWEFPGGKLHAGETPEAALIRELHEELGIDVSAACLAPFAFASHAYERFHLLMPLYLCRRWGGTPEGREGQALAWVRPARLASYPMPPADVPLVALLRDFL